MRISPDTVHFGAKSSKKPQKRQRQDSIGDCITVAVPGVRNTRPRRELDHDAFTEALPKLIVHTDSMNDNFLADSQLQQEMGDLRLRSASHSSIGSFVDPDAHLRAKIPELGSKNPFKSASSSRLVSPKELCATVQDGSSYLAYGFSAEVYDSLSGLKEWGAGGRTAIRKLAIKANKPERKIDKKSAAFLKAADLMNADGTVPKGVLQEVRNIVRVEGFSQKITLIEPQLKG